MNRRFAAAWRATALPADVTSLDWMLVGLELINVQDVASSCMKTSCVKLVLAAVFGVLALMSVSGCQDPPPRPTCETNAPSDGDALIRSTVGVSNAWCQAAFDNYEAAQRRSFVEKLRDGDRESWKAAGAFALVAVVVLAVLRSLIGNDSTDASASASGSAAGQARKPATEFESMRTETVYEGESVTVSDQRHLDGAVDAASQRRKGMGWVLHQAKTASDGLSADIVFAKKTIRHHKGWKSAEGD